MSDVKPSIRELVWLASRRQTPLFDLHAGSESPDALRADCDDPDCLPWHHKRSECVEWRKKHVDPYRDGQ